MATLLDSRGRRRTRTHPVRSPPPTRHPYPAQDCPVEWVERGFRPCLAPATRMTSGEPFPLCVSASSSGKRGLCSFIDIRALPGVPRACVLVPCVCVLVPRACALVPHACVLAIARVHPEFIFETPTHSARGPVGGPSGGALTNGTSALFKKTHRAPLPPPPREDTGEQGHQKWALARRGILDCPGSRAGRNTFLLGR